jgi:hypothetical protein
MALDPITGAEQLGSDIVGLVGRFFPDKTEVEKTQIAAILQVVQGQLAANTAEAAQPGLHFRDGAGWVCVAGFALMVLKAPIEWACALAGHPITLPAPDTSISTDMLLGLLGLGGMHVYQTSKGK